MWAHVPWRKHIGQRITSVGSLLMQSDPAKVELNYQGMAGTFTG